MKRILSLVVGGLIAGVGGGLLVSPIPAAAQEVPAGDGYEELTRGPVHEAFAESVSFNPSPGLIVDTAPPGPIDELPPEVRPEGGNVLWVPGYWMWEEEEEDYLWISGVWRDVPPGRQWTPGYWNDLDRDRWQWVSGYWEDTERSEVNYISTAPPETLETGPSVLATSSEQTWMPGIWVWSDVRYVWRPGYWSPLRTGWTWVPARYVWTPLGYVFVDGYWDYEVGRRGVLFAPVRFHRDVWARPGFHYRPSIVVSLNIFSDYLFYRPRASHYYFGDYYDSRYRRHGFDPVFAWHSRRGHYDPIFAYQSWAHRDQRNWLDRRRERFDYLTNHADARPPVTWAAMQNLRENRKDAAENLLFASRLSDYADQKGNKGRFQRLSQKRLDQLAKEGSQVRRFAAQRKQWERAGSAKEASGDRLRERLSAMPIRSRAIKELDRNQRPPQRLEPRGKELLKQAVERAEKGKEPQAGRAAGPGRKAKEPDAAKSGQQRRPQAPDKAQQEKAKRPQQKATESQRKAQEPQRKAQESQRKAEPQRKAQEPQRKAKEPQRKAKEPQRKAKEPQRKAQEPQRKAQEPQRKAQEPQRKAQEPQRKAQEPQRKAQEPQRKAKGAQQQRVQKQRAEQQQRTRSDKKPRAAKQ